MSKKPPIHPLIRVMAFIVGMAILITIMIAVIDWGSLDTGITIAGADVTTLAIAGLLVMVGIVGSTLVKSSLLGDWRLD